MQHKEDTMQVLYPCCCGLDIHKASITACVLIAEEKTKKRHQLRCGTMTRDLLALADWLAELGVTHVAMESTGVYFALSSALIGRVQVPPALR
jgi:transposase